MSTPEQQREWHPRRQPDKRHAAGSDPADTCPLGELRVGLNLPLKPAPMNCITGYGKRQWTVLHMPRRQRGLLKAARHTARILHKDIRRILYGTVAVTKLPP